MFYEMWFPFPTNMERIYVIQNLRQKEIILSETILNQPQFEKQVLYSYFIQLLLAFSIKMLFKKSIDISDQTNVKS